MSKSIAAAQILHASMLGTKAQKEGRKKSCGADKELMAMVGHRSIDFLPEGEAKTSDILRACNRAYDAANIEEGRKFLMEQAAKRAAL